MSNNKIPTRIFVAGGSIVYGEGDHELGGWVNRLKLFHRRYNGKFNQVYNLGISGRTTKDMLSRVGLEIERRFSSAERNYLLLAALSVNDSSFDLNINQFRLPLNTYKEVLDNLVKQTENLVDNIVFIGPNRVDERKTNPITWAQNLFYQNNDIQEYNEFAKEYCIKNKIHFIDTFSLLEEDDFEDGLHPNAGGHEKIFQTVKDYLIKNKLI